MAISSEPGRILYIQYTNPGAYPPLLHSSQILAKNGWRVLFLGTSGSTSLTLPEHPHICSRSLAFCAPGWKQKIHYLGFSLWCVYSAFRWRPDWVYASDLWSCLPSILIRWLFAIRVVYHEHDAPTPHAQISRRSFLGFTYWARKQCARIAELCVIPNENRARLFQAETGCAKVKVVWNCPSLEEVTVSKNTLGPVLKLLYHGSVVPERLPLAVIHALKQVSHPVLLKVVGYETAGSVGYLTRIRRAAAELNISDRLEIIGAIPHREDMMRVCATCDVGLALMPIQSTDVNLAEMTGASNKPFDYLACGLAVLVSRLPSWQKLFVNTGYGLDCEPSESSSIAAAIQYFCDHPEQAHAMGERGRQRILSDWNYQAQFQDVIRLLSQGFESPARSSSRQSAY